MFGPVFWLAVGLLRAFPCLAQWRLRSRQAYSSGGCAGMTGCPASPASRFTRPKSIGQGTQNAAILRQTLSVVLRCWKRGWHLRAQSCDRNASSATSATLRPGDRTNAHGIVDGCYGGTSRAHCRLSSEISSVGSWPGADRHLNRILPAGTAGGLSKPTLKAPRLHCREWL